MKFISTNGSHAAKAGKSFSLIIAIALILVLAVGGTIAYIVTQTGPVINTFTPASSAISVDETVEGNAKTKIAVKNDSTDILVYVRVALVANKLENGKVTGAQLPSFTLSSDWIKIGEYYYSKAPVAANGTSSNMLSGNMVLEDGMQVVVLTEAIQANPTTAVTESWKVTLDSSGHIQGAAPTGGA